MDEARGDEGLFGEERIGELVEGAPPTGNELLERLLGRLERYTGGRPADDDRTVVAVTIGASTERD